MYSSKIQSLLLCYPLIELRHSVCPRDVLALIAIPMSIGIEMYAYYGFIYVILARLCIDEQGVYSWAGVIHIILWHALLLLTTTSHFMAFHTNPGFVEKSSIPAQLNGDSVLSEYGSAVPSNKSQKKTICTKCDTLRPPRSHHCSICDRCVMDMDHHCPWIGNCVGAKNVKFFILFLLYACLISLYTLCMALWFEIRFYFCIELCSDFDKDVIIVRSLELLSAVFLCFSSAMGADITCSVVNDTTFIEILQRIKVDKYVVSSFQPSILFRQAQKVFGDGPIITWLLPIPTRRSTLDASMQV